MVSELFFSTFKNSTSWVLILVLVEDGLRVDIYDDLNDWANCLNPCSCGGWSQRLCSLMCVVTKTKHVLILVLVEDGLRAMLLAQMVLTSGS